MAYNQASTTEHVTQTTSFSVNSPFLKSPPGILKIIELVIDIIIWICVGATPYYGVTGNGGYINFSATITFIFTLILVILYLTRLIHRLPGPWILIECVSLILSIFFLGIAMLVGAFSYSHGGGAIAAAVFCALNATVYGVEIFLRFRISRSNGWNFTVTAVDGDISIKHTVVTTDSGPTSGPGAANDKPAPHGEFGGDHYGVP